MSAANFHVCLHDVHPVFEAEFRVLFDALERRIGRSFSLAVTPCFGGVEEANWSLFLDHEGELLLHGITHRRKRNLSPYSIVNRYADEWAGRSPVDFYDFHLAVLDSKARVEEIFGRSVMGGVAPCYAHPRLMPADLAGLGLALWMGYRSVLTAAGKQAVESFLFDWGAFSFAASSLSRLSRSREGLPTLVLHPMDVRRGLHLTMLRVLDAWLAEGRQTCTLSEGFNLACAASGSKDRRRNS